MYIAICKQIPAIPGTIFLPAETPALFPVQTAPASAIQIPRHRDTAENISDILHPVPYIHNNSPRNGSSCIH